MAKAQNKDNGVSMAGRFPLFLFACYLVLTLAGMAATLYFEYGVVGTGESRVPGPWMPAAVAAVQGALFWGTFFLLFRRMFTRPLEKLVADVERVVENDPSGSGLVADVEKVVENDPSGSGLVADVKKIVENDPSGSGLVADVEKIVENDPSGTDVSPDGTEKNGWRRLERGIEAMGRGLAGKGAELARMTLEIATVRESVAAEVSRRCEAHGELADRLGYEILERKNIAEKLAAERSAAEEKNRELAEENRELREMGERAREAALKADMANIARGERLAGIEQAVREPMDAVKGMAELLLKSPLAPEQREYVETISGTCDELWNTINRALAASIVEAGNFAMNVGRFDPAGVVENTCAAMAGAAHGKGLELICRIQGDVPERVVGDPTRFKQILIHLLENAVKFTREGEVFVEVGLNSRDEKWVELVSAVKDTGPGIEKERQGGLFESVLLKDGAFTRRLGEKGRGLLIARRLTEMMGGRIWVESAPGRGSRFGFTARFQVSGEKEKKEPLLSMKGLKILILEENRSTGEVVSGMLSEQGAETRVKRKGEEGLAALFGALDRGRPYDLVILGTPLSDMDAFRFLSIMRKNRVLQYAAVVTLSSMKGGDLIESKALGVGSRLTRPVKRGELFAGVNTALGRENIKPVFTPQKVPKHSLPEAAWRVSAVPDEADSRLITTPPPGPVSGDTWKKGAAPKGGGAVGRPPVIDGAETGAPKTAAFNMEGKPLVSESADGIFGRKRRILLAEDTEDISNLIKAFLKKSPCSLDVAANGAVAVKKFKENKYDMVLMDIEMPVMDGLTATRTIRSWEKENDLAPVSIVALTAHALLEHREKTLDAGCDAHFVKPIKKKQLLSLIEEFSPA